MKTSLSLLLASLAACMAASCTTITPAPGDTAPVTILVVRHAETDQSKPHLPLSAQGEKRAQVLEQTLRGVRFTHLVATHTVRARQMLDAIAAKQGLKVAQLPAPGTTWQGETVTDQTSRRAPIEPVAEALSKLPAGSVALAALNSENIYAILNKLGVPAATAGQKCEPGATCVPCLDNTCYPRNDFDHLWVIVTMPGAAKPISFTELRYGQGWKP